MRGLETAGSGTYGAGRGGEARGEGLKELRAGRGGPGSAGLASSRAWRGLGPAEATVNVLDFVSCAAWVAATQLCPGSAKAALGSIHVMGMAEKLLQPGLGLGTLQVWAFPWSACAIPAHSC